MKNSTLLLVFAAVLILLITLRKPINMALSRGLRNNNPGNIRLTFDKTGKKTYWIGEIDGEDKSFKKFKTLEYGYRAMFITLTSYISKGVNTIEKMISRYAPSNENKTESYIATVSSKTNIAPSEVIDNDEKLKKIVAAISFVENGVAADQDKIKKGYQLFKTV